jgi:hypothetical protein
MIGASIVVATKLSVNLRILQFCNDIQISMDNCKHNVSIISLVIELFCL